MHGKKKKTGEKRIKGYKSAQKRHADRANKPAHSVTQHRQIKERYLYE
jgi:hypothetical protein